MQIIDGIAAWAMAISQYYLLNAPMLGGGWERWAQGDMSLYMKVFWQAAPYQVATELRIFTETTRRADILVTALDATGTPEYDIVELKAWQQDVEFLPNFYKTKLAPDIVRVQGNVEAQYAGAKRWAVGLVTVSGFKKSVDRPDWTDQEVFDYVEANFRSVNAGGTKENLNHHLVSNGAGSLIITWWSSP
ncbi:MAG: hypothetical protein M1831_006958 [Alyxoria varia]|nr:MAG: hypothetical protein M1831_006958 [Alyxoria varia]